MWSELWCTTSLLTGGHWLQWSVTWARRIGPGDSVGHRQRSLNGPQRVVEARELVGHVGLTEGCLHDALTATQAGSNGPGLFCASTYIESPNAESMGGVKLNHTGAARKISVGNDDGLAIGGYVDDNHHDKRSVLAYGKTWTRGGSVPSCSR